MTDTSVIVSKDIKEYRTRKPQYSPYYKCIEDKSETFERVYEQKYEARYRYLRPIVGNFTNYNDFSLSIKNINDFIEGTSLY